jgi:hypothetical protein
MIEGRQKKKRNSEREVKYERENNVTSLTVSHVLNYDDDDDL